MLRRDNCEDCAFDRLCETGGREPKSLYGRVSLYGAVSRTLVSLGRGEMQVIRPFERFFVSRISC